MLAPLPRWQTTRAARSRPPGRAAAASRRCTRRTGRGSRSGARPRRAVPWAARTSAPARAANDGRRCRSRPPAAARAGARASAGSASGCAAGAAAPAGRTAPGPAAPARSMRIGCAYFRPPCTTRWPMPFRLRPCIFSRRKATMCSSAPSWPSGVPSAQACVDSVSPLALLATKRGAVCRPSAWPRTVSSRSSPAWANSENLMLDEPAFSTAMASRITPPPASGLRAAPWRTAPPPRTRPGAWAPSRRGWSG